MWQSGPVTSRPDLRAFVGSPAVGLLPDPPSAPASGTLLLDLGDDHPTRAGLLELQLWVDDDRVTAADVIAGHLHRGVEKLFELRDYRQVLSLADRHDWQAPFAGELTVALAVEELMGLEVPVRARWLRTLLAEHTRVHSHLGFLGWLAHEAGRRDLAVGPLRDELRGQMLRLTGNRVHPMVTRIGGLATDASPDWLAAEVSLLDRCATLATALRNLIGGLDLHGLAPVGPGTLDGFGLSGPVARATGRPDDERVRGYLTYPELDFSPVTDSTGDAAGRFRVMADEVVASRDLTQRIVEALTELTGPISVDLPRVLKVPEAQTYLATEAPLGHAGVLLVSRGQTTPWRLRLRTPSAANVSALPAVLRGVPVDRLEAVLASIGWVIGDVDK